jgi:two-component system, cell cycle sensor histidine kinase and response regulator CckA
VTRTDHAAADERPTAAGATAAESTGGDWSDALRASEQQFWREFGPSPVGLVVASLTADRGCGHLAVNETYCELTGYSRQELLGSEFLSCFHPEDQPALEILIGDVMPGGTGQIGADARLVRADGEIVWTRLTGSVRTSPAGARYLAIFVQDTTAARQAQAEIHRLQRELQQTRRLASLGQLVSGISHDFSNTLTVIANYASLIRDEVIVAETTESAAKWGPVRWDVEQIEQAADQAKRLIKHLLAFARRQEAEPVLVDIGQMISDAAGLLSEVLGEHVPVIIRQAEGLWPVQADPGLLKLAIVNIAVNARDAMPGGGQVAIDAANIEMEDLPADWQDAELAELLPGRYVAFRVTDTGTGMDATTAERAFEPFFTTKSGNRAAGLGLPAVRRFATQAGGQAWLRSEPGQGTTVTVVLPAADPSGWQVAAQQGRVIDHAGTVLVVDDEAAIRDVAHRVLTSAGYRVMTAANGHEALGLLEDPQTAVDLVLTDIVMPGMTAAAFAAQARAVCPGLPVLFMSGYEQYWAAGEGWPDPEAQVISKPFSRAALLATVTQMLAVDVGAGADEQAGPWT